MSNKTFCAQMSRECHEPFVGTASRVDTWLLIEYTGSWRASAVEHSDLSAWVKTWLFWQSTYRTNFRTLFIRQHHRPLTDITCFVCTVREDQQQLYRFTFQNYEELTSLDIEGLRAGDPRYQEYLYDEPLYLVCSDGKHDMCCAKYGVPIYQELAKQVGSQAWQCSHLGGDKFAANVLYLPKSLYYGRVTIPDIEIMLSLHKQQQIYLDKFRGCTSYSFVEQAADYFLRVSTGVRSFNVLRRLYTDHVPESEEHTVVFENVETCQRYQLTLAENVREVPSIASCKGCWRNTIRTYSVTSYNISQGHLRSAAV